MPLLRNVSYKVTATGDEVANFAELIDYLIILH